MSDFSPINEARLAERLAAFREIERKLASSSDTMHWLMKSIRNHSEEPDHA